MGTKGVYGITAGGKTKFAYNGSDSYPDVLGRKIVEFIKAMTDDELVRFHSLMTPVNVDSHTDALREEIEKSAQAADCGTKDWKHVLEKSIKDFDMYSILVRKKEPVYVADGQDFMNNQLCLYAYIINMDKGCLEYHTGIPKKTFGHKPAEYVCDLVKTYPLDKVRAEKTDRTVRSMELRRASLDILHESGCSEETYEGVQQERIKKDLIDAKNRSDAVKKGLERFFLKEIAEDIYSLSTTERGWETPVTYDEYTEINSNPDIYGIAGTRKDAYIELEKLVKSGKPFVTSWLWNEENECSFKLYRKLRNGVITVSVSMRMDEGADLVSDAIPNSVPYDIFSEQETEDITNEFLLDYRDTSYEASEECTVAGDTGLKEILEKVSELCDVCNASLDESFEIMKQIVARHIEEKKNGGQAE